MPPSRLRRARRLVLATRAALGIVTLAAVGVAALLPSAACTTRSCIGSFVIAPTGGTMIDADTWESNALTDTWQPYSPEETLVFQIPALANREILDTTAYISPVYRPDDQALGSNNWTIGSGNLAEFENVNTYPGSPPFLNVAVHNDTCANYFTRVVIHAAPLEASDAAPADDDADADAGTTDGADFGDSGDAGDSGAT